MQNYVVVMPNGTEVYVDDNSGEGQNIACKALRQAKITTKRLNPQKITVKLYLLGIEKGTIYRSPMRSQTLYPDMERATETEFVAEQKAILEELPVEFHSFVSLTAWEHGHSGGYEEVIMHMKNIVHTLKDPISKFERKLLCGDQADKKSIMQK